MITSTLACGPYFHPDGVWASLAILLFIKPLAYYGFIQAFRYRVSAAIPMRVKHAVALAVIRAILGALLVGGAALVLTTANSEALWSVSWVYLYLERLVVWAGLGWYGARLRGRRLVGWTLSGTGINAAFDVALVASLLTGFIGPLVVLILIAAFIAALHVVGQRESLKRRFSSDPLCAKCFYNLTGNLSGICPECGTQIVPAAIPITQS